MINTKKFKNLFLILGIFHIIFLLSKKSFANYSYQADGFKIICNGACPVYPDKPSFIIGTNNFFCFRETNIKGGIWALSTKNIPQHAKCVHAGGYIDESHYIYCQQDNNCNATMFGNIINLDGYMIGLPYTSYKKNYNFSLICKGEKWEQKSESTFLCKKLEKTK